MMLVSSAASALVTILMLLTAIAGPHGILSAAQIKSTPPHLQPREYLLKRLFPNRDLDQEEIDEEQLSIEYVFYFFLPHSSTSFLFEESVSISFHCKNENVFLSR
jgi:hypothetical protein